MEDKQSRRRFLNRCAALGGACCALLAWNKALPAQEESGPKKPGENRPIDFGKLSYCSIPCAQACELYKATQENDVNLKKLIHEKWEWKKKFGIDFAPEKVFCYTCKPGDKPMKPGMAECEVRKCALANGVEACVQCRALASCNRAFWKEWPAAYEFAKKLQARYLSQPGAALVDAKSRP